LIIKRLISAVAQNIDIKALEYIDEFRWHRQGEYEERLFFAEETSTELKQLKDELLEALVQATGLKMEGAYSCLMVNVVRPNQTGVGSGGGWHRDSHRSQIKVICYLSDVTEFGGAFEWISESRIQRVKNILKNHFKLRYRNEPSEFDINKELGRKGTVIIVDTSCVHRGGPVTTSARYAATLYFYSASQNSKKIRRKLETLRYAQSSKKKN